MATSLVCGIDLGTRNSLCALSRENTQELVTFGISKNQYHLQSSITTMEIFFVGAEGSSIDSVTIRYAKRLIGTPINELGELSKPSYGSPLVELDDHYSGF